MGKAARSALEAQWHLNDLSGSAVRRQRLTGQVLDDDHFHPLDVDQVEGQGPTTGLVAAQGAILVRQTQQGLPS